MEMLSLKIENLSKTYNNGVQALKNIDLAVPAGMFGLLGPNGAGKSTLMRTIATLQDPDQGNIFLGNTDVLRQKKDIRRILGYLPQDFGLYSDVTAEAMLNHFAVLKGITVKGERREMTRRLLQETGLYDHRRKKLGTYSGGMKQRFGVAQALLGNPRLIIVDEPSAGLDPEARNHVLNLLSHMSEDMVVILSTHIVEDVRELCGMMAVLSMGKVLRLLRSVVSCRSPRWRCRPRTIHPPAPSGTPSDLSSTPPGRLPEQTLHRARLGRNP